MRTKLAHFLFAGLAAVGAAITPAIAQTYTITDLGTLGGGLSVANAINSRGDVVGYSFTADFVPHAFIWRDGVMTDLGTLGGVSSEALDINDAGQVVGVSRLPSGFARAFLWQNGRMTDLGTLPGFEDSRAAAINNAGVIVGKSSHFDGSSITVRACVFSNPGVIDLGGGPIATAFGVNNVGQIVGTHGVQAALFQNGNISDLGLLPGGSTSIAYGVNNGGSVVGQAHAGDLEYDAVVFEGGQAINLGGETVGFFSTEARAINDRGTIVGHFVDDFSSPVGAIVWRNRVPFYPIEDVTPGSGFYALVSASDINSSGQFVGFGYIGSPFESEIRAYRITQTGTPCDGDVDGDRDVDLVDLSILLAHFGWTGATHDDGDVNNDVVVDIADLSIVLGTYGAICQ